MQQTQDFQVILLNKGNSASKFIGESSSEKAIQRIETDSYMVKVTTILPYKLLPNGELINSFAYSPVQTKNADPTTTEFVDISITVTAYYASYFSWDNMVSFYRHAGIEAYWSSSNSSVSVSNMTVWFDSIGDLHKYPECLTEPLSATLIENDFYIQSVIDQDNPVQGKVYIDGKNTMSLNQVIYCKDYFQHGGLIYLKMSYSANGKSYVHNRSYYVYSK